AVREEGARVVGEDGVAEAEAVVAGAGGEGGNVVEGEVARAEEVEDVGEAGAAVVVDLEELHLRDDDLDDVEHAGGAAQGRELVRRGGGAAEGGELGASEMGLGGRRVRGGEPIGEERVGGGGRAVEPPRTGLAGSSDAAAGAAARLVGAEEADTGDARLAQRR